MRKLLLLVFTLVLSFALVACGNGADSDQSSNNNEGTSEEQKGKNDDKEKDSNTEESDVGKLTILYKNKELDENAESGPINLNVNAIQLSELEVSDDYKEMFDNKDKVTVIALKMKVENSSDDTISIYPDQATITTDAGDQVDADVFLSESIGGDFIGKVKKEGDVIFVVNSPANDIGQVNLIVDGAHDENYDKIGEQIKMSFTTK